MVEEMVEEETVDQVDKYKQWLVSGGVVQVSGRVCQADRQPDSQLDKSTDLHHVF